VTATAPPQRPTLPQLTGTPLVTDGGLETDLIFHHGLDLPDFAAFPLLESAEGRAVLAGYFDAYADIATTAGAGLLLECPTWRANPDWGARLGYGPAELARVNAAAITFLAGLRDRYAADVDPILVGGTVGPKGDGYVVGERLEPAAAAAYHRPQLEAFAAAGADLATAYTLTDVGEAIGVVLAARSVGLPVAISFTVETDGRLPSGTTVAAAVDQVDAAAAPDYFLLNCAHPDHLARGLQGPGRWRERIIGVRSNASTRSHAELDEAAELDEGDPVALAAAHAGLRATLPGLTILGGCCGTDHRHVRALWAA
jgi:homocysteine S-methyltransferase